MSTDWPKTYSPQETENKIYQLWEESGFFAPENLPDQRKKKFVTCLAPPNITGELHLGHALETTLQDIIVRFKRMQGYKTLWLPGTDHAGIGAQNVVEKQLAKEGTSRHQLGREKFTERMWRWRDQYGHLILEQFKKLGLSVDWSRTRFTLDPEYHQAVMTAFVHYYEKGWIYQSERVVNWCVRCATSISDLEVNYLPEKGKLYFIKYGPFTLATVRPETKLGDTGLAVHPQDPRYEKYIGRELEIDSVDNSVSREQKPRLKKIKLKVVADQSVDLNFGTGIIKVTPAHDLTDSEIGQRHDLAILKIINEDGRLNENAGARYLGLKVGQAREQIVKDLESLGLIEKIDDYQHNVARCDRCRSVIEPLPSKQWFLKMADLAKLALKAVDNNLVRIQPERWLDPYKHWLNNVRDWNISRQLWWGHRLPVWIHEPRCIPRPGQEEKVKECKKIVVSTEEPKCEYCDANYRQSEDVLDTWFSSALWPFASLGWPDKKIKKGEEKGKSDFKEYYPTDLITSDRGILFLWQVRMIFSGLELTGQAPFQNIYIHATVLTKDGRRMSKSLGTGVNPLTLIEKYGADALRFGLASQATGLQDLRFGEDLMIMGKKFANKIWNIARFVVSQTSERQSWEIKNPHNQLSEKMDRLAQKITEDLENYRFAAAAGDLYQFIWHELADKFIEESKDRRDQETQETLIYLLLTSLKLLHPFMPFLTEEVYSRLPLKNKQLLLVEKWPV